MTHDELAALEDRLANMIEDRMSLVKDVRRRTLYGLVAIVVAIGSWWIGDINGRVREVELNAATATQERTDIQRSLARIEGLLNPKPSTDSNANLYLREQEG